MAVTTAGLKFARRLLNRKFRGSAGVFLVEGAQACREAVRSGAAERVLATSAAARLFPDIVAGGYETLMPGQVEALTDTVTPQGIFAICRLPEVSPAEVFAPPARLVVIGAQVRDPGNLGTVVRCADAFGADGVILTTGSVDLTNPKTLRASVGSVFHLPVATGAELGVVVGLARAAGFSVLAADGSGESLGDLAEQGGLDGPVAWILGNEAWGLGTAGRGVADRVVRIDMWGKAESLNLGAAASVCLYATASRQRRHTRLTS